MISAKLGYGIKLIITKKIQKLCYMAVIVLGIIHLNVWYMNYQENYYHQLQFQQEVSENKEIQRSKMYKDNENLEKTNIELNEKIEALVLDVSNSGK